MKTIVTILLLGLVSVAVQAMAFLPWWSFVVPIFLLGIGLPLKRWNVSAFLLGFTAGFLVWVISTIYFEMQYEGEIIKKISLLFNMPKLVLYGCIGSMGGVLTGLSFYSGYLLRSGREVLQLDVSNTTKTHLEKRS